MAETTQMTLSDFLLARIADEEALARDAATEGTPRRTGWQLWTSKVDTTPGGEPLGPRGSIEASPARVLAECEAKRQIVAMLDAATTDGSLADRIVMPSVRLTLAEVIAALALPYADHPDYRQEWKP